MEVSLEKRVMEDVSCGCFQNSATVGKERTNEILLNVKHYHLFSGPVLWWWWWWLRTSYNSTFRSTPE